MIARNERRRRRGKRFGKLVKQESPFRHRVVLGEIAQIDDKIGMQRVGQKCFLCVQPGQIAFLVGGLQIGYEHKGKCVSRGQRTERIDAAPIIRRAVVRHRHILVIRARLEVPEICRIARERAVIAENVHTLDLGDRQRLPIARARLAPFQRSGQAVRRGDPVQAHLRNRCARRQRDLLRKIAHGRRNDVEPHRTLGGECVSGTVDGDRAVVIIHPNFIRGEIRADQIVIIDGRHRQRFGAGGTLFGRSDVQRRVGCFTAVRQL